MLPTRFTLPILLLAFVTPARAVVSIDVDLDRLRALPGAPASLPGWPQRCLTRPANVWQRSKADSRSSPAAISIAW